MKRLRIAVLLALLGGCVLLAWAAFQPVPPLQIAVRVTGYTNDATGMRWAVIGVTNVGMMKSFVYRPKIEVESAGAPRGFAYEFDGGTNQWNRFHSMLGAGEGGSFVLPAPTNQQPWRISLLAYNDYGWGLVKRVVFWQARKMPHEVEGDWVR